MLLWNNDNQWSILWDSWFVGQFGWLPFDRYCCAWNNISADYRLLYQIQDKYIHFLRLHLSPDQHRLLQRQKNPTVQAHCKKIQHNNIVNELIIYEAFLFWFFFALLFLVIKADQILQKKKEKTTHLKAVRKWINWYHYFG